MKLLTSLKSLAKLERSDLAELNCLYCDKIFFLEKYRVERCIERGTGKYCSRTCARHASRTSQEVHCANCNVIFRKQVIELKRTSNHFCSRSCAAQYNNRLKKLGSTRRSKAEEYLCSLIYQDFPEIIIKQNDRTILPSGLEVDIFVEKHQLAIELNGPTHYFPIYGETKFKKIQASDLQKRKDILTAGYKLITINISDVGYFKKVKAFLEEYYVTNIKPLLEI